MTLTCNIPADKHICGRSLLGFCMYDNAINTLKEVLQVKDGEAAAIAYALKILVDGDGMLLNKNTVDSITKRMSTCIMTLYNQHLPFPHFCPNSPSERVWTH